jgi:hypothetical protein
MRSPATRFQRPDGDARDALGRHAGGMMADEWAPAAKVKPRRSKKKRLMGWVFGMGPSIVSNVVLFAGLAQISIEDSARRLEGFRNGRGCRGWLVMSLGALQSTLVSTVDTQRRPGGRRDTDPDGV